MSNALERARALGQSTWYDNISRDLIASGELARLVALGVTGVTSNPTIFEKAVASTDSYDEALGRLARTDADPGTLFEAIATEDIRRTADILREVYDHTAGADGYVSLEVSPHLAYDTDGTVAAALRLFAVLDRPNVMIKVPATPAGVPAVRTLIAAGVNVNVTLIFSLDTYRHVMEAYLSGLEEREHDGRPLANVASVASFFVSRVDTLVDRLLEDRASGGAVAGHLQGTAAIANARKAYALFRETFGTSRFARLRAAGARVQRPLWASTSTKNPAYPDTLYVDALVGPDTVNTMPPQTIDAVLDHGDPASRVDDALGAERSLRLLSEAGIDLEAVTRQLLDEGVTAFANSYDGLLRTIQAKCGTLVGRAG